MSLKETFLVSPLSVPGCQLWFDAADTSSLSLSGSSVTQWRDKSGNSRNATSVTGTPVLSNNTRLAKQGIYFNGSSYITGSYSYSSNTLSWFVVGTMESDGDPYGRLLSFGVPAQYDFDNTLRLNALAREISTTQLITYRNGYIGSNMFISYSVPFMYSSVLDGASNSPFLNGTAGSGAASSGNFGFTTFGLSSSFGLNIQRNKGFLFEVVVYATPLAASNRQRIEGYLAWKWGMTANLPANHPFKTVRPLDGLSVPLPLSYINPKKTVNLEPFDPRSISGCQLWLDAADSSTLTFSGSKISSWRDKTQNTNVVQATSSFQPTYLASSFNNLPTLQFVGVQGSSYQYLQSSSTSIYNSVSAMRVFAVMRVISTPPNFPSLFSIQNKVSFYLRGLNNSSGFTGNNIWTFQGSTFVASADTVFPYDTNTLSCLSLGATQQFFLNGSDTIASPSFSFGSGTNGNIIIGWSGYNANDGFNGYISEILVYTSALTTTQRQQVEGYLAWKWGLTASLPANHPFKTPLAPFPLLTAPRKGGLRSFSPKNISGLQLWLDATDVNGNGTPVANGATVSTWTDKSGNSRNATQTTGNLMPTYNLSAKSISFNGGQYFNMSNAFSMLGTGGVMTIFVVERRGSSNGTQFWLAGGGSSGNNGVFFGYNTSTVVRYTFVNVNDLDYTIGAWANPDPIRIWGAGFSGTIRNMFLNGSLTAQQNYNSGSIASWNTPVIGYIPLANINTFFTGQIYEILFYNSFLSTAQRQTIEGYLAWKWGLQSNLPSTQPFKLFPPPP
jgi:hypothetical protein